MADTQPTDIAPTSLTTNELTTMASIILSRTLLAARAGQQFGGSRDLYTVLGYKKELAFADHYARFRRQNIARRIITSKPSATWRHAPLIHEDKDRDTDTPFEAAWKELDSRVGALRTLKKADELAGIGRYGILLIGTRGSGTLESPLQPGTLERRGESGILYLRAYHEGSVTIRRLETSTGNERFGQPTIYELDLSTTGLDTTGPLELKNQRVHWTRVIHIAEDTETDDILGTPRLEAVDTLFDDLAKVVGGSAEMFWSGAERGLQADIKEGFSFSPEDQAALSDEIDEYYHGLRRFIRTQGVDINKLAGGVADPSGPFGPIIDLIAGTTGIPKRILIGSERGELASTQDQENWVSQIQERHEQFAEPSILRPFIDRLIWLGALPTPEGYEVEWPSLFTKSDEERAKEAMQIATAVERYARASGQGVDEILPVEEFRERFLGLPRKMSV